MVKKQNHKIFKLIVMIFISILLISMLNISYAQEIIYGQDEGITTDYVPDDKDDDAIQDNNSNELWLRENNNTLFQEVRKNVAQWYYIFRYTCIAIMLIVLLGLGIKLAISSIAEQKAIYKRMILDWVVCFILLFMVHYFMIFVQFLNERLIYVFEQLAVNMHSGGEYSLYETVRSRAYDMKLNVGFPGMVLYITLIWLTAKYVLMYAKRFIMMVILTIMAPIMVLFYGIQKIFTGRSKALTKWMGEYMTNTIMQAIHAMIYAVFIGGALKLAEDSLAGIIISFVMINFMSKADTMFRNIFKFSDGSSVAEEIAQSNVSDFKDNLFTAVGVAAAAKELKDARKTNVSYASGVRRDMLKALKLGKVVDFTDNVKRLPGNAGLLLASKVKNGLFEDKSGKRESKYQAKNNAFNSKINGLDSNISNLQNHLKTNGSTMSDEDKAKFQERLNNLQKERNKVAKEQGNYNTKMGVYERAREFLDPDTYLETVFDPKTGSYVTDKNGNPKRRMAKRQIIYDAETNSYKKVGGFREKFGESKAAILGLSDDDKKVLKEMTQVVKDGTIGAGALILGMGSFAENPALGFALLATGAQKTRNFAHVKDNGLKMSRWKKRRIAKALVEENEKKKYTNAQFTSQTILNMDEIIRLITSTEPSVAHINDLINRIQSGKLKYAMPLLPYTLTGTKGGILNLLYRARDVAAQHEANMKKYLVSLNVEYSKSLVKEILQECETTCMNITTYMMNKESSRLLIERQLKNGSLFVANGMLYGFDDDETRNTLTREDIIKQAIIQTALKNKIYSFDRFDLDKKYIQDSLIEQLKTKQGLIIDKDAETEFLVKRLIDGYDGEIGIKDVLGNLSQNSPDLLKTKLFQTCIIEYANERNDGALDNLTDADKKSIMTSYRNKLYYDHTGSEIQSGIMQLSASLGKNISDLTSDEIMSALKNSNQTALSKLEDSLKAKASGTTLEQEVAIKQKQIDSLLNDMVLGVLANNNIANPSDIDLINLINDEKMQSIKAQLLALFSFAFKDADEVNISDDELTQILQMKIASSTKEDVENTIIKDICAQFVAEECDGDISKLSDPKYEEELQRRTYEKLKELAETQEEKDSYEDVLKLIEGMKNSKTEEQSSDNQNNSMFYFDNVMENSQDSDEVADFPLPVVTAKYINDKLVCKFEVPAGTNEFELETCKKTKSTTNDNYIVNMDTVILDSEDEIACARLIKDGKHGLSLVVKYPADAMKIASKISADIDKAEKSEEKRRDKAKTKNVENIALNVFDSLRKFDRDSELEDVFGEEQVKQLEDSEIEMLLRESEIRSATNRVLDVADMLRSKKVRMNNDKDKDKVLGMIDDYLYETEDLIGLTFGYDDIEGFEEYKKSTDALVNKLLQMKIIDDDNDKLEIKSVPEKDKAFKKLKQQLEEGIEDMDINQIILKWKGVI